jgi:hypothetical protein
VKFLLDANMPRAALDVTRSRGHGVEHVRDIGLGDATTRALRNMRAA